MPRHVDRDGSGWGKLLGKLGERVSDALAPPARKKREKRFRMDRDSRRGMSGRGQLAGYAAAGPMTLEELLARLDGDQRALVLAMPPEAQERLLRVYEAFDRHLQAPGSHKAAVLDKLGRALVNGRLLGDRRNHGGLLARLAARVGASPHGPLRGRVDGLTLLSYVVSALAEPAPGPAAGRDAPARAVAALTNSLALAWPARWAEIALALACDGAWQGIPPVLRPGGSLPDGLIQGSLLAYARTLPPDGDLAGAAGGQPDRGAPLTSHSVAAGTEAGATRSGATHGGAGDLTVGQLDLLARILECDRGAELDVEGREPSWALTWLAEQLAAGVPARAGIVHDGKGLAVRVVTLSDRAIACEGGLVLTPQAFLAALRRVVVDGEFLSRVGL
ncbi:MAG: hypothetical protein FJZ01_07535 [Candidatus Sericytochromatia bacterium]|nr:hypothetical protein [Candidatus Tanganyikabacteria bacterium]